MRPIRCIAIDDEPMALLIIEQFCKRKGGMVLSAYSEPNVGLHAILSEKPDLVFLDIQMNCIDGLEIADKLPSGVQFIFTTAHAQYAIDGFELDAVDFLHKPFSYERFAKAVDKAMVRISAAPACPATLVVKEEYSNITIPVDDILYIEALGNYVKIYRASARNVLSRMKMKEVQAMLPPQMFVRIHRSFIVSKQKIERYNKNALVLKGVAKPLPIGRSYFDELERDI